MMSESKRPGVARTNVTGVVEIAMDQSCTLDPRRGIQLGAKVSAIVVIKANEVGFDGGAVQDMQTLGFVAAGNTYAGAIWTTNMKQSEDASKGRQGWLARRDGNALEGSFTRAILKTAAKKVTGHGDVIFIWGNAKL